MGNVVNIGTGSPAIRFVGNVEFHELDIGQLNEIGNIFQLAFRQVVENPDFAGTVLYQVFDDIGTDETGAARDQERRVGDIGLVKVFGVE